MLNNDSNKQNFSKLSFWGVLIFCLFPGVSAAAALALGLVLALLLGHPYKKYNAKAVKYLLQISVVGLGFGMNFKEVLSAGKSGVALTVFSIFTALTAGYIIGRVLRVSKKISYLISVGTAICGGSAIAAVAPIIEASEQEAAVSLGTVFILNAAALFIFPIMGHVFGMSSGEFGSWAAIAIHDTSSVVGAAAQYGTQALKIATTIKLTRALWIVPLAFITTILLKKRDSKIAFPYFILAFLGASVIVSLFPSFNDLYCGIAFLARRGLTVTLFLIGAGLTKETLQSVGFRPVVQGFVLWIFISCVSFGLVVNTHF